MGAPSDLARSLAELRFDFLDLPLLELLRERLPLGLARSLAEADGFVGGVQGWGPLQSGFQVAPSESGFQVAPSESWLGLGSGIGPPGAFQS